MERYQKEIKQLEEAQIKHLEPFMDKLDDMSEAARERLYQKVNLPAFKFEFPPVLSKEFTAGKLSEVATEFVAQYKLEGKDIAVAIRLLEDQEQASQKHLAGRYQKFVQEVFAYSTTIKPRTYHAFSFGLQADILAQKHFYFSFNAGYPNAYIKTLKASLTIGQQELTTTTATLCSNDTSVFLLELFEETTWNELDRNITIGKLNLSYQLDNGQQFELERNFHLRSEQTNGVLYPITDLHKAARIKASDLYGITQLGIADFRKVEQQLCCYVPGEVSHIENIMAREYKEKSTRNLLRTENIFETTTEKEVEELNDTTTATRFDMSSEVANVINKDQRSNYGFSANVNGNAKIFGQEIGFNVGGYGDFSFATSSQNSNTTARNYAEDVTRRALERIVQKTSTKRSSTMIKEFEQNYKHGYDNREGDKHVTGVYRWIDKVYKNQVVNYGKRLMYEFMLPEPARFFYQTIYEQANNNNGSGTSTGTGGELPVKPTAPAISSHLEITRENYAPLAANYGASVSAPMASSTDVSIPIAEAIGSTADHKSFNYHTLQVPTHYECHAIHLNVTFDYNAWDWTNYAAECYIRANFAGINWAFGGNLQGAATHHNKGGLFSLPSSATGMIPISMSTRRIKNYNGTVRAICSLSGTAFENWQLEIYNAIMGAYNHQLEAYNAAVAAQEAANTAATNTQQEDQSAKPSHNSAMNGEIIITELKRLCIEMMTQPFGLPMGQDFYGSTCQDIPSLNLGPELDYYGAVVKFFEQAFDWQLMTYTFYKYFWSDKCTKWKDLLQRKNGVDHIFQRFIQSGMSRLIVPVREGFEKAVLYFMETGQVWNGLDVIVDMDNPLYLSILEELKKPTGDVVGEPWYTTVPSTLNIIQGRSSYLNETGLPCCGELDDQSAGKSLLGSKATLQRLKD